MLVTLLRREQRVVSYFSRSETCRRFCVLRIEIRSALKGCKNNGIIGALNKPNTTKASLCSSGAEHTYFFFYFFFFIFYFLFF